MIINLRGTHGSGKSYAMRKFLKAHKSRKIYGLLGPRLPEAYELTVEGVDRPVYVLGSYVTTCGGCDLVQPYACVMQLVSKYDPKGHVVFEGLLLSGVYGTVTTFLETWKKQCLILFLDTSLEVSIERVRQRRKSAGKRDVHDGGLLHTSTGENQFDPHNVRKKYANVLLVKKRMLKDKIFRVQSVSSDGAADKIGRLLRKANGTVAASAQPTGAVGSGEGKDQAKKTGGRQASVD